MKRGIRLCASWPCATAASLLLALVLGLRGPAAVHEPAPPAVAASRPRAPLRGHDYFQLRRLVLAQGVDALPEPAASSSVESPPLRVLDSRNVEGRLGS